MTTKKYIKFVIIIFVIAVLLAVVSAYITSTFNTIISNHLAVGQLENDSAGFILMETYNNLIKPIGSIILIVCYIVLTMLFITQTWTYIKNHI